MPLTRSYLVFLFLLLTTSKALAQRSGPTSEQHNARHLISVAITRSDKVSVDRLFFPFLVLGPSATYSYQLIRLGHFSLRPGVELTYQRRTDAQESYQSWAASPFAQVDYLFDFNSWGLRPFAELGIGFLEQESENSKLSGIQTTNAKGPVGSAAAGLAVRFQKSWELFLKVSIRSFEAGETSIELSGTPQESTLSSRFTEVGISLGAAILF